MHDDRTLSERFEILAYDHRGLGSSAPDDPHREPTMADYAADALIRMVTLKEQNGATCPRCSGR